MTRPRSHQATPYKCDSCAQSFSSKRARTNHKVQGNCYLLESDTPPTIPRIVPASFPPSVPLPANQTTGGQTNPPRPLQQNVDSTLRRTTRSTKAPSLLLHEPSHDKDDDEDEDDFNFAGPFEDELSVLSDPPPSSSTMTARKTRMITPSPQTMQSSSALMPLQWTPHRTCSSLVCPPL